MDEMFTKVCKDCGRELPMSDFKVTRYGTRADVCLPCAAEKYRQTLREKKARREEIARNATMEALNRKSELASFTPRELMQELARRGYEGKLKYTQEIDITNF